MVVMQRAMPVSIVGDAMLPPTPETMVCSHVLGLLTTVCVPTKPPRDNIVIPRSGRAQANAGDPGIEVGSL